MRNMNSWVLALSVAGALRLVPAALAQQAPPPPSGKAIVASVTVTATVTKIDQKTREVTLKASDGQVYSFVAGADVQNLAQVKKGDVVTATYTEAIAYEVKEAGTQTGATATVAAGAAAPGAKPAGVIGGQVTVTVTIVAINASVPSVTFKAPDGTTQTVKVQDPAKLQGVKVGDTVVITYAEALAIKVEKKPKN